MVVTDGRPEHQEMLDRLTAAGWEVHRVAAAAEAREALRRGDCHAVLALTDLPALSEELGGPPEAEFHRAGRELLCASAVEVAAGNLHEVVEGIGERLGGALKELLGRRHVCLHVLDDRTGQLEPAAAEERVDQEPVFAGTESGGIVGYVATTGRPYVCDELTEDPRYRPLGLLDARSSLTVPVKLAGKVLAVVAVESPSPRAFTPAELRQVEVLADYVALALHGLRQVMITRYDAVSETVAALSAEMTGPLRDIRAEATGLTADFIGHDEIHKRLGRIVDTVDVLGSLVGRLAAEPASAPMAIPAASEPCDPFLAKKRVLVADDEDLMRTTIHDLLVRVGAIVDVAADGAEAERQIDSGRYDLVISDIKMPRRDGYQVFAAAKRRCADTAVILITGFGYDPNHSIVRASAEGLSAVLLKPFKVKQLLDEIRRVLA